MPGAINAGVEAQRTREGRKFFLCVGRAGVEREIGAQLFGEFTPLGNRIKCYNARAHGFGREHAARSHRAEPPDAQSACAAKAKLLARAKQRAEGVRRYRSGDVGDGIGNRQAIALGNNEIFRVAAVSGEAETAPVLAKEEIAHPAGRANAAADGEIDRDAIARLESPHACTGGDDDSSGFVPRDAFARSVAADHRVAVVEAQIAAANARRFDLDEDFARPWGRNFDGANLDPLIAGQEHRFHRRRSRIMKPNWQLRARTRVLSSALRFSSKLSLKGLG